MSEKEEGETERERGSPDTAAVQGPDIRGCRRRGGRESREKIS